VNTVVPTLREPVREQADVALDPAEARHVRLLTDHRDLH
jgi:hypothetical protein